MSSLTRLRQSAAGDRLDPLAYQSSDFIDSILTIGARAGLQAPMAARYFMQVCYAYSVLDKKLAWEPRSRPHRYGASSGPDRARSQAHMAEPKHWQYQQLLVSQNMRFGDMTSSHSPDKDVSFDHVAAWYQYIEFQYLASPIHSAFPFAIRLYLRHLASNSSEHVACTPSVLAIPMSACLVTVVCLISFSCSADAAALNVSSSRLIDVKQPV